MFGMKATDEFERLMCKAEKVSAQRAEVLRHIGANQMGRAALEEALADANKRVAEEEFEAAQVPNGLAVASKSALTAVNDIKLRVKSVQLRVRGLESKLAEINEKLVLERAALDDYIQQFITARISELENEFEAAVESLIGLFHRAWPLVTHSPKLPHAYFHNQAFAVLNRINIENPFGRGASIATGVPYTRDGKPIDWKKEWRNDAAAGEVGSKIEDMKRRAATITGAAKDVEGLGSEPEVGPEVWAPEPAAENLVREGWGNEPVRQV